MRALLVCMFLITHAGCALASDSASGARAAEQDFAEGGAHIASFGTEACMRGYGLSEEDRKLLAKVPQGPSECGCTDVRAGAHEFVSAYNRRMIELVKQDKKNKAP